MKCVLPSRGIRAFGKAIFCLAKLGEDLYFEGYNNGLALKTVNGARSAYACFLFDQGFFLSYIPSSSAEDDGAANEVTKCKISNKSCLSVFKSLSTLERSVENCRIKLDKEASKLVFVFHCKHGIVKTHSLGYQECDVVQAVFDKSLCTSQLKISSRTLSEVVSNFPNSLEEVTLKAESARVTLKNYVDEHEMEEVRVSLTEVALTPSEFDSYQVTKDASLTFCVKELRALLLFTDSLSHPLTLRFETAGRPMILSVEDEREYKVDLVLATLVDESSDDLQPSHRHTSTAAASVSTSFTSTHISSQNSHQPSSSLVQEPSRTSDWQAPPTATPIAVAGNVERQQGDKEVARDGMQVDEPAVSDLSQSEVSGLKSGSIPTGTLLGPKFPSGSQFRRSCSASAHLPRRTLQLSTKRDHASSRNQSQVSRSRSVGVACSSYQDNSLSVVQERTVGVGSGQSKQEEMSGMIDSLFGGDEGGAELEVEPGANMFGHVTVLQDGPCPSVDSRVQVALEKTGPTSLSQFGRSVVDMSTPCSKAAAHGTSNNPSASYVSGAIEGPGPLADNTISDCTQDNTNDSYFLPGTPPSKKFKGASVLFGMDWFPEKSSSSYILAPDSASDSD